MMESQRLVYDYLKVEPTAVIALEIGGGNGLQGMILGSSTLMNLPTVDGDWMGRAYPTSTQTTPTVLETKPVFLPCAISDGNGNNIVCYTLLYMRNELSTTNHSQIMTTAVSEQMVERSLRAALSMMGSHVGCAKGPVSGANTKKWVIENTVSLAWRIGRAVALSRASNQIETVAESIINEVGGLVSAKLLFKGKIVGVERLTRAGHAYGEVIIDGQQIDGHGSAATTKRCKIPFKNENILAMGVDSDGKETVRFPRFIYNHQQSQLLMFHLGYSLGSGPHLRH